jgi:glycosyltransferase involved in cell wall biosynthesis
MAHTKLVVVTQQVDPGHPALAATVTKLRALAERVDELVVLALGAVPDTLPPNCRVRTFGGASKPVRTARYLAALAQELRDPPVAVLAHMCPIYAVLAAPLTKPRRVPLLLWYTHWKKTRTLAVAARVCDLLLSVDRRSVPLAHAKVRAIGHGIDPDEFPPVEPRRPDGTLRLVALGRYSRAKGLGTVLRALQLVRDRGVDARLVARGPILVQEARHERHTLETVADGLGLRDVVDLGEAVPRDELPALLAESDVLVNNMRPGAPDKVVYEAAASCLPVVASNPVFDELLPKELRFPTDGVEELADRLVAFASTLPPQRRELGRSLRARVVAEHSVAHWADEVMDAVRR